MELFPAEVATVADLQKLSEKPAFPATGAKSECASPDGLP
jgi:hypothetical protein